MKQWTLEERYKVLHSPEEIKELYQKNKASVYRQTYHVQPMTGLSSDPNGFAYHNGVWHLFYQWCPWGAVHGLKYWYHVSSNDLVFWKNEGIGLRPDHDFDNKGVHSGSAISIHNELYLFYTGNHRDENWVRIPYTCLAKLNDHGKPVKQDQPLFGPRSDYSEHQRDPKVFYVERKKLFYIFLGAQTLDKKGCILVYTSKDLLSGWSFAGQLKVPGYEDFGGMWECPCIQSICRKDVLLFSPQYIKLPNRKENTNHNVYLIGHMDYDSLTFTPEGNYHFLDYGFDFYAAQLASNHQKTNKSIMIAWMGLPDNHYPSQEDEWEGSMTLPRELKIENGRLIQSPLKEMEKLRDGVIENKGILPDTCEILLEVSASFDLNLLTKEDRTGGIKIHYDCASRTFTIDKTGMDIRFNENLGEALSMTIDEDLNNLQIFIDKCSMEIFINGGIATFTAHCFPTVYEHYYTVTKNSKLTIYKLRASVTDDFVI